jgi:hypothetical protein
MQLSPGPFITPLLVPNILLPLHEEYSSHRTNLEVITIKLCLLNENASMRKQQRISDLLQFSAESRKTVMSKGETFRCNDNIKLDFTKMELNRISRSCGDWMYCQWCSILYVSSRKISYLRDCIEYSKIEVVVLLEVPSRPPIPYFFKIC